MTFDFDRIIDRSETHSVKFDARKSVFGQEEVIPLWIADMDFAAPDAVTRALIARASHPLYGYTLCPESLFQSLTSWFERYHHWTIQRDSIVMCPGVVPSLAAAIQALTTAGDKVIVQPPVYPPFFSVVTRMERELLLNPLKREAQGYTIDFEHLEECARQAKLLLFCSPHNPVGRVWQQAELEQLLEIARRYKLTVLSDEIHADLVFPGYQHIPLAALAADVPVITAVSPSKSFNIPGLGMSCLIVDDPAQRKAIEKVLASGHISISNPFGIVAFEAAYREGRAWLEALMAYLENTRQQVSDFLQKESMDIQLVPSQGTYLLWLDCSCLGLSDQDLKHFFVHEAGVGMNPGLTFGQAGSGFMRMNIASPRSVIMQALACIKAALA